MSQSFRPHMIEHRYIEWNRGYRKQDLVTISGFVDGWCITAGVIRILTMLCPAGPIHSFPKGLYCLGLYRSRQVGFNIVSLIVSSIVLNPQKADVYIEYKKETCSNSHQHGSKHEDLTWQYTPVKRSQVPKNKTYIDIPFCCLLIYQVADTQLLCITP